MASLSATRDAFLRGLAKTPRDKRVLEAFARIPREHFVPETVRSFAYEDIPLPLSEDQTISQPTIVALMTEALALTGQEVVLEVGAGSGYQAAILSHLAGKVVSVERHAILAERAAQALRELGIGNVAVHVALDRLGWPPGAPYDAIIVTAAAPAVPQDLLEQLRDGGTMVIPVGSRKLQELIVVTKRHDRVERRSLGGCRFVPLIGPQAWSESKPS